MTMIRDIDMKCAICGKISPQPMLISTNSFGYTDLDMRPPEMQRSTMITWVLECPHCGYVASDLEKDTTLSKDFLKSEGYLNCDNIDFKSDLAKKFYRSHLISTETDYLKSACFDIIYCAWACDDAEDIENAVLMRKIATDLADILIGRDDSEKNLLILLKADLLRRSGEFERLIEEYQNITLSEEIENRILEFQIEKARESDTNVYTTEEVIG